MPTTSSWRLNRPADVLGTEGDAWARIALWAGSAAVFGLAAATIQPVAASGAGAVIFAGAGGASLLTLALGGPVRAAVAALTARHAARTRTIPARAPAVPGPAAPAPAPTADPMLAELVGGLAAQFARLDQKLEAALAGGAFPASPDDLKGGPETLARAMEALKREQQALRARLDAEAKRIETHANARADALAGALLPRVDGMGLELAELRDALAESDTRERDFECQVFDMIRARDAGKLLRELDAEASDLFDKLFEADERRYPTAEAWRSDYAEWRTRINAFWDVLRGYRTGVEQPFAVSEADVNRAGAVPDKPLFSAPDMRFRYKMLVVVNERHMSFREGAFSFNAKKGSPPEPSASEAPHVRLPSLVAG